MMSKKHKKVCSALNYFQHFLFFLSVVSVCVLISDLASSVCVPVGITSSAVELKTGTITAAIEKYRSFIKKEEKTW